MSKLPEVDLNANPAVAESFKRVRESRGWVSNLMKSIAHAPEGLRAFAALGHYARYDTNLTELQRELTICTTVRSVPYGWGHHAPLAMQCGATKEQMDQLKRGEIPRDFSEREQALCRYVLAFSSMKGVSEEITQDTLRHFSSRQISDFALISSFFLAVGSIIIGMDVELEPADVLAIEQAWQRKSMAKQTS